MIVEPLSRQRVDRAHLCSCWKKLDRLSTPLFGHWGRHSPARSWYDSAILAGVKRETTQRCTQILIVLGII
jgi:hypothetical protein